MPGEELNARLATNALSLQSTLQPRREGKGEPCQRALK